MISVERLRSTFSNEHAFPLSITEKCPEVLTYRFKTLKGASFLFIRGHDVHAEKRCMTSGNMPDLYPITSGNNIKRFVNIVNIVIIHKVSTLMGEAMRWGSILA
jgi:hypothetical protein